MVSWKPAVLDTGPETLAGPTRPGLDMRSCRKEGFLSIYADNVWFSVLFPFGLHSSEVRLRMKWGQQVSVLCCAVPSAVSPSIYSCHVLLHIDLHN